MSLSPVTLFVYGTLRAPEVQRALFGRETPGRPASLDGHRLFEAGDYWFAAPAAGCVVHGELLALDDEDVRRADLWEDVPVYQRVAVTVRCGAGEIEEASMYTRLGATGAPVEAAGYASRPIEEVVAAVRAVALHFGFAERGAEGP